MADTDERLRRATGLFIKQTSISEISQKIASAVDESLSKQQKGFFLRQQLAAIQRELASLDGAGGRFGRPHGLGEGGLDEGSNEDELAEIKRRFEAMLVGSEERKMADREWRRLKRIPQQSAEHGVIHNYVRPYRIRLVQANPNCRFSWNGSLRCHGQKKYRKTRTVFSSSKAAPSSSALESSWMPTIMVSTRSRGGSLSIWPFCDCVNWHWMLSRRKQKMPM